MAGASLVKAGFKALAKGAAKSGRKVVQEGLEEVAETAIQKGATKVATPNLVPTPRVSTDDWFDSLKIPKGTSEITEGDLKAIDSAQAGAERPNVETMLQGMQSKDPVIKDESFGSWNEYIDGIRGANHFAEIDHQAAETAAEIAGVRQPRAGLRYQSKGTRATGSTPAQANIGNTPDQIKAGEGKYQEIAKRQNLAPHHKTSFADAARVHKRHDSKQIIRDAGRHTEVPVSIGHTVDNLMGSMHKFNAKARADKIGSILEQKPDWTDAIISWEDPVLGRVELPRKRLLSDLVKDTTDANMPGSDTRFNWNSIGIPNGKKGEARWPDGNLVTDNQRRAAWVGRFDYHGIDRKAFKIDPAGDIKGFDHVDVGHTISEMSPEYQAFREMVDSPDYAAYPVEEAGKIVADWLNLSRRVFININQLRLDFILEELGLKVRIGKTKQGRPRYKYTNSARNLGYVNEQNPGLVPEKVQDFINKNPARAAIVGYRDLGFKNDELLLEMLRQKPKEVTPMLQQIFLMAEESIASIDEPATAEAAQQLAQMYPGN